MVLLIKQIRKRNIFYIIRIITNKLIDIFVHLFSHLNYIKIIYFSTFILLQAKIKSKLIRADWLATTGL